MGKQIQQIHKVLSPNFNLRVANSFILRCSYNFILTKIIKMKTVALLVLLSFTQLFAFVDNKLSSQQFVSSAQNHQIYVQTDVVDQAKQNTVHGISLANTNQIKGQKCRIYFGQAVKTDQSNLSGKGNVYAICSRRIFKIEIESGTVTRVIPMPNLLEQNVIQKTGKIGSDEWTKVKIKQFGDVQRNKFFKNVENMLGNGQEDRPLQGSLGDEQKSVKPTRKNRMLVDCHTANCTLCGNGVVDGEIEQCDDGNSVGGDGCTSCVKDCGNGVLESTEQCDDHNTVSGDGCSERCLKEGQSAALIAGFSITFGAALIAIIGLLVGAKSKIFVGEAIGAHAIQTFGIGQVDILGAAESKHHPINQYL